MINERVQVFKITSREEPRMGSSTLQAKKRSKDKGLSEFTDEAMESSGEGNLTMNLKISSIIFRISTKLSWIRAQSLRKKALKIIFWHTSEITKIIEQSPRAEVLLGNIGNLFITPSKAWLSSSFGIKLD